MLIEIAVFSRLTTPIWCAGLCAVWIQYVSQPSLEDSAPESTGGRSAIYNTAPEVGVRPHPS